MARHTWDQPKQPAQQFKYVLRRNNTVLVVHEHTRTAGFAIHQHDEREREFLWLSGRTWIDYRSQRWVQIRPDITPEFRIRPAFLHREPLFINDSQPTPRIGVSSLPPDRPGNRVSANKRAPYLSRWKANAISASGNMVRKRTAHRVINGPGPGEVAA